MWNKLLLATLILICLHCTSGVVPRTSQIEVAYIGSILEDLNRQTPISAGLAKFPGIKIAHTITEPAFMEYFLYRAGLAQLLDALEIDYVVSDTIARDHGFFTIPKTSGYAISNIEGIRFAIYSTDKESLTIEDQVQLTLVRQRSDVLWILDQNALDMEPTLFNFYIDNRALASKSTSPIRAKPDMARQHAIKDFMGKIEEQLNTKIRIDGSIDEYLFSTIAEKQGVNVIIYPQNLIAGEFEGDSVTLLELMGLVAFEMRFKKASLHDTEISEICALNDFRRWGDAAKENVVLLPDGETDKHFFDFYYEKE